MRIALDASYSVDAQPSGIGVYSRQLLHGLAAQHPEDFFYYCYRPKQFRSASASNLSNVRRKLLLPIGGRLRADVFHALNQRLDRRPARVVISTFHDLFVMTGEYSSPDFRERFTRQARQAAQLSDLIITVSEFTARQVSDLLNVDRQRIRVVPHGVSVPPVGPSVAREPIVLFIGVLQERKNIIRLVEAFESLPKPWKLVLAGAPTGYRANEILARVAASSSRERIEISGYVSDQRLRELLARASVFAFPSLDEGFGIPVLEAMAWGVPVITSNNSGLAELAHDAALLVNPLEVGEIETALRRMTESPSLCARLTAAGKKVAAKLTWENAVQKTYAVYREIFQDAA